MPSPGTIDSAKFRKLYEAKEKAAESLREAENALTAANEARAAAGRQWSEACNDLQDYVQECAGDKALGGYRR